MYFFNCFFQYLDFILDAFGMKNQLSDKLGK